MNLWTALGRASAEGSRRPWGPVAISGSLDVDPRALLASCRAPWCFWDNRDEVALGIGAFAVVDAGGATRFSDAQRRGQTLFEKIRPCGEPFVQRLYGSFAFSSGERGPFAICGDAHFVLPRLTLVRRAERTRAVFVVDELELDQPDRLVRELESYLIERAAGPLLASRVVDDGRDAYVRNVERALSAIANRRVDKLVTRRVVRLRTRMPPERVLADLALAPNATRFGLRTSGAAFVAATPELLCEVRGRRIRTEALAGTSALAACTTELSGSEKDRREHAHVVRGISEALGGLGIRLEIAARPELRSASHVRHLATPIEARRPAGLHVLELVEALHPTPAVGGFPRDAALEMIGEIEPDGRGPYAAPCGWFDAKGDGSFAVGIRSALFRDRDVYAFAGGGIVAGSEPERELFETELKLRTMLTALRVSDARRSASVALGGPP